MVWSLTYGLRCLHTVSALLLHWITVQTKNSKSLYYFIGLLTLATHHKIDRNNSKAWLHYSNKQKERDVLD